MPIRVSAADTVTDAMTERAADKKQIRC